MINATRNEAGDRLQVALHGTIDRGGVLAQAIGPVPSMLEVDAAGVQSINSLGVKEWIGYFSQLRKDKVSLSFVRCSPAIVGQFGMFSNFVLRSEIRSIYLPYVCTRCSTEFLHLQDLSSPAFDPQKLPELPCPKCNGPGEFDDVAEDYFNFMV